MIVMCVYCLLLLSGTCWHQKTFLHHFARSCTQQLCHFVHSSSVLHVDRVGVPLCSNKLCFCSPPRRKVATVMIRRSVAQQVSLLAVEKSFSIDPEPVTFRYDCRWTHGQGDSSWKEHGNETRWARIPVSLMSWTVVSGILIRMSMFMPRQQKGIVWQQSQHWHNQRTL